MLTILDLPSPLKIVTLTHFIALTGTKRLFSILVHPDFLDALECRSDKKEFQRVTGDDVDDGLEIVNY